MRQLSQRALGGVVGGTMLVLGIAMLVLAKAPVQVVVSLPATGLLVSGAGRILGVRDAGPWRARWLDVVLGAGPLACSAVSRRSCSVGSCWCGRASRSSRSPSWWACG